MPRYLLTLEYDGTPFVGWQRQKNGLAVQEVLEKAAERLCQSPVDVTGAGRTDAGVHARGQAAHVDLPKAFDPDKVRNGLNAHMREHPVSVLSARDVSEKLHARFSATGRHYLYRILNRRAPPALLENRVWWVPVPLDAEKMQAGANRLLGKHDFSTFRAAACQAKSPVKTLDSLVIFRKEEEIRMTVSARSFLHHQVRNFAGTLKQVGEGKWTPADVEKALKACDRSAGGPTAPAAGLYLTGVDYPDLQ